MQVEGEGEVAEGQCGTKGRMAPEFEEKSMYSPINTDRWLTGKVVLYSNKFREEDKVQDDCEEANCIIPSSARQRFKPPHRSLTWRT
jgi:hypothetical protein